MDDISLKSSNSMVLLPMGTYKRITRCLERTSSKSLLNLLVNTKRVSSLVVASESSLSKDWLKKEEMRAWQNL